MQNEIIMELKKLPIKELVIAGAVGAGIAVVISFLAKKIRKNNEKKKKIEFLQNVMTPNIDKNGESYAKKAQELEALIFNKYTTLYGWEADTDGILKLFANYSKKDVDNVLKAYAILYPPSVKGGTWVGDLFGASSLLIPGTQTKEYKGDAFLDLQNIEDKKDYEKILNAYQNLK